MKRIKTVLFFLVITSMIMACGRQETDTYVQKDYSDYTCYSPSSVVGFIPANLETLEQEADYIIKGKFLDDAEPDLQHGSRGQILYGCTISTFAVDTSYKGALHAGDQIDIVEEYYINEEQKYIYCIRNYYPSDVGREYLLFLKKNEPDYPRYGNIFYPCGNELGRYPSVNNKTRSVTVDSLSNAVLNLGDGDSELYRSVYQEVIEEYMS